MATAIKRPSASPPAPVPRKDRQPPPEASAFVKVIWSIYRFLASLKLAVFSLGALAAVLAVGTWVESRYGTVAVQDWVYRSWWFAILLAFLATNILCAALIRYPWTKRQTGFVITHTGLLTVLAGAFISFQAADEGQVALAEGETTDVLVRPDHPVIRVREVDPHTRKPLHDFEWYLPFRPGPQAWSEGRYEVLTDAKSPFRLAIKNHLPASAPRYLHESTPDGVPMIKIGLLVKQPQMLRPMDLFRDDLTDDRSWLVVNNRALRAARSLGPALIAFQYLDSDERLEQFLHPPETTGPNGVALIHYTDRSGKRRTETVPIDDASHSEPRTLPDSDLTVSFEGLEELPGHMSLDDMTGGEPIHLVKFKVRKADGAERDHIGWASLPMMPSVIPDPNNPDDPKRAELVHIDYVRPLVGGRFGTIEIAGTPDGRLYYRASNQKGLKNSGKLELGKAMPALGGGNMPMSIDIRVDQYITSGRERLTFQQLDLPVGKLNTGVPCALAELSCDGESKEVLLQRAGGFDPNFKLVKLPGGRQFELAYDVDRKPLGFSIALDDFDVGLDPGTQEPSSYRSDIRLTDLAQGLKDKPITISMNNTMSHRGWTFYQSNYIPMEDPETRQPTGQFMSVFQVGYDPGRILKYLGCFLVFGGAIVQFYMRAGIFSDGGKLERARAERKAARKAAKGQADEQEPPPPSDEPPGAALPGDQPLVEFDTD